jgi:hypothetical protein
MKRSQLLVCAIALLPGLGFCDADVQLNTWTMPSSGMAGSSTVHLSGTGFPSGTILPQDTSVVLAAGCNVRDFSTVGANVLGVTSTIGTGRRIDFAIPASMRSGRYKIAISGKTSSGIHFASTRCSDVMVYQHIVPGPGQPLDLPVTADPAQPKWFYLIDAPSYQSDPANPMVLGASDSSLTPGTTLTLGKILNNKDVNAKGQLWQLNNGPNGSYYLQNGLGSFLVMSTAAGGSTPYGAVLYASQNGSSEGGSDTFQHWTLTATNGTYQITNGLYNQPLYVSNGNAGTQAQVGTPPGDANQWMLWPGQTLAPILAQQNQPYPSFTGDSLTAYNYISSNLPSISPNQQCTYDGQTVTGVRCEYINTAAPLANIAVDITALSPFQGVSTQTWQCVVQQLEAELTAAASVQSLYNQFGSFYNSMFINNQSQLNEMIGDAAVVGSANAQGSSISLVEGVLYTAIEGLGGLATGGLSIGISALGNLMETAVNTALASGSVSATPYNITVNDLWGQFSTDFQNILTANGQNEASILQDWGRSQAVSALINSTGPDSLQWTPTETAQLVSALTPGFDIGAMQILLPAQFPNTWKLSQVTSNSFAGAYPLPTEDTLITPAGPDIWDQYAIGGVKYPSQTTMQNDILGNGVNPLDFFTGSNGWENFQRSLKGVSWLGNTEDDDAAGSCNGFLIVITNQTPDTLDVSLSTNHGFVVGSNTRAIPPYTIMSIGANTSSLHGPDVVVKVTGPSGAVSFEAQQDYCDLAGGDQHFTTQLEQGGYKVNPDNSSRVGASYGNNSPGIQPLWIWNPNAQQ